MNPAELMKRKITWTNISDLTRPLHPFLLCAFPVLFLYANNAEMFPLWLIFRPLLILEAIAVLAFFLLGRIIKDRMKAALVLSVFIFAFFLYSLVLTAADWWNIFVSRTIGSTMPVLWLLVISGAVYLVIRTKKDLTDLTKTINFFAICVVAISVIRIILVIMFWFTSDYRDLDIRATKRPDKLPNIYYIIMDGYGRQDILEDIYSHDNSEFVSFLENNGFYVAGEATSNYMKTVLSVGSSLNMMYYHDLESRLGAKFPSWDASNRLIKESMVCKFLKSQGYTTVYFNSGIQNTDIWDVDVYLSTSTVNEYEIGLLNMTPVPPFIKMIGIKRGLYDIHRERILHAFEELPKLNREHTPFYVFVHLVCPHPPFVFGKDGEERTPGYSFRYNDGSHLIEWHKFPVDQYIKEYAEQLVFMTKKLTQTIDAILKAEETRPIILIQADHGPGSKLNYEHPERTYMPERFGILNAYLLPEGGDKALYPGISPVNSFRIVFNHLFGTDLELLEDSCFFTIPKKPFEFIDVTERVRGKKPDD